LAGALFALLPLGAWAADPQITDLNANPNPVTAGGLYTYAVGIDNSALEAATNTVLTFTVPSGASFVSASGTPNPNCVATSATLVTCAIGTLVSNPSSDPALRRTINLTWRAMVAGGSRFNKDIPPYTIADSYNKIHGINAVGLKRAGLNAIQRLEIKRAFLAIYRSNHPFRIAAVEALKSEWGPEAREFFEFIVSSKRGICGRSVPRGDSGETE
jgi:uncharacterized repeat protein (TIGR01451 family)